MRRTVLPFLTTLFFAGTLWIAVNLAGNVHITLQIPLSVDLPSGRAASSPLPRYVAATVSGPGWSVAQFAFLASPMCRIRLDEASTRGESAIITRRAMLQSLGLPAQLDVTEFEPDTIAVRLDMLQERMVPIVPALRIECRHGFEQTGPTRAVPESVRVSGAAAIVERIASWSTRPIAVSGATGNVRLEAELSDSLSDLVSLARQPVILTAAVQETGERLFERVPVHVVNTPSGTTVRIVPRTVAVLLRGGSELLAALGEGDVNASVDYLALENMAPDRAMVEIAGPSHTTVLSQEPRSVAWYVASPR